MKRRQFLKLAGIGTAVATLPVAVYAAGGVHRATSEILRRELHYLTLDPAGVERFANEYFGDAPMEARLRVGVLSVLRRSQDESWLVGDMVRQYLMGSDFFTTGMDELRTVHFLGLYDPYSRPCQHPFSAKYWPEG